MFYIEDVSIQLDDFMNNYRVIHLTQSSCQTAPIHLFYLYGQRK